LLTRCTLIALCLFVPFPALSKTLTHYDHPLVGEPVQAALTFARTQVGRFGVDRVDLRLLRTIKLKGGLVVRLSQQHQGREVLGAGLSVLILGGRVQALSGTLHPLDQTSGAWQISRAAAQRAVVKAMPTASIRSARKVYRSVARKALPTWELDLATDRPFGLWRVLVDGSSGEVLRALSTMVSALGSAYETNPKISSVKQVELLGLAQVEELSGTYADVQSCGYNGGKVACERLAQPDQQGNYFYKPDEPKVTDPFSEVHAYYHVDAFHRWMASRFGFARPGDQQIKVNVNLHSVNSSGKKQGIANAFFGDINGDGVGDLSFGQGNKDFAYDADVVYHEFTHSAVDATSDLSAVVDKLGFNMMPAGLNEGFADLMSSAFTNDAKVGDYAGGSNGIRNLVGATLTCPKDLSGESHADGLIWGRVNWAIRQKVKSPRDWDAVVYKTMAGLGKYASFADATALLLKVASAADPAMAQIAKTELTARGMPDCTRIVPLKQGQSLRGYVMGRSSMPTLSAVPGPVQYKIEVPSDAEELRIDLVGLHYGGSYVGAYIRKGEPVDFIAKAHDFIKANNVASVVLKKGDKDKPLEPGATYYALALNVGNYQAIYQASVWIQRSAPLIPDAAPTPDPDAGPVLDPDGAAPINPTNRIDTGSGGCSCSTGGAASGAWPALFALALLVLLRRRR
jgi:MYXO-CTERM domain-containing protein